MCRSNWPPNCIVPLQIAQVQVSTELLEVSGMDSKDSSPKTVLPKLCLRNLPAVTLQPLGRHCGDGLSNNFNFFKLNAFTFPNSKRALETTFESHSHGARRQRGGPSRPGAAPVTVSPTRSPSRIRAAASVD